MRKNFSKLPFPSGLDLLQASNTNSIANGPDYSPAYSMCFATSQHVHNQHLQKMTCTCKVKTIKSNIANGLSKNQIWKVLVNCLNPNLNPIRKLMKNKEALKQWRLQEEVEDGPHQRFISNPRKNQAAVWRISAVTKNSLPISTRPPAKIAAALKVTSATKNQSTISKRTKK